VSRVQAAALIEAEVGRQLPRVLRDKLRLYVLSDPWGPRVTVRFYSDWFSPFWNVEVVPQWQDGMLVSCSLPDEFIARLCVEVL
jgi:hypothetical protein